MFLTDGKRAKKEKNGGERCDLSKRGVYRAEC